MHLSPLFRLGSVLAIAAFAACTGPLNENPEDLRVQVFIEEGFPGNRSLSPGIVTNPGLIDYYEVVFKDSENNCYVGTGTPNEVLTVSVPPGKGYRVLLLAGSKQKDGVYVLLASSFGTRGVDIVRGAANVVTLPKFTQIAFDPTKNLKFGVGDDAVSLPTGTAPANGLPKRANSQGVPVIKIPLSSNTSTPSSDGIQYTGSGTREVFGAVATFTVKPLFDAQKTTQNPAAFDGATLLSKTGLVITPLSATRFNPVTVPGVEGGTVWGDSVVTADSTGKDVIVTFKINRDKMPDVNATGRLYFELGYSAFSLTNEKLTNWRIRPGLNYALERYNDALTAGNSGGAIAVEIGAGGGYNYAAGDLVVEINPLPGF